ncbi:S-formylglutathione hydrolase FrmB [Prevotella sp. KH2C16]|nr:S-formylglutathione hydrolase FrmB [Prevotella sp. KH2C16]
MVLSIALSVSSFAGKVDTVLVHSDVMNKDIKAIVVTPTPSRKARNVHYPVVYLLHGASANCKYYLEKVKPTLPEIADRLGFIFVTPDALNSWYFDSPVRKNYKYETFMSSELVSYIDSAYNTIPEKKGRAITGLSMGGHGALYLAFRHKEVYGACGSMSGGVDIRPFPRNWELPYDLGEYASHKKNWDANTVVNQIDRIEDGDLSIIIDCGEGDFFLEVNKSLHERLLGRKISHDFTTRPGEHNSAYWENSLDYQLLFFKKYFERNGIK